MTREEMLDSLISYLLDERGESIDIPRDGEEKFRLFRSLVNIREPGEADKAFLALQDSFLRSEIERKGITDAASLEYDSDGIAIWQGDITTLRCTAIVNAANSGGLGCFHPCHGCIDNAIHTFAGVELRSECDAILHGREIATGDAIVTKAFSLPSRYIIHTVGPIVRGPLQERERKLLAKCYETVFRIAEKERFEIVAIPSISTGVFGFPIKDAAPIAISETRKYRRSGGFARVVFNLFSDDDRRTYESLI